MAVILSLCAAFAYGLSDFVGGVGSRRLSPWAVALTAQLVGATGVATAGLVLGGSPTWHDFGWALLAGLGNGVGTACLYRGLSAGRMGVVAPISGVGAALLPLTVGVGTGERPGLWAWVGFAVALPAIWLVAREPAADDVSRVGSGVADGVCAGVGFGTLFVALAQIPEESGLLPLAANQLVGAVIVVALAASLRQPWLPRGRWALAGAASGVLGTSATVLFLTATHAGYLTVAAVLTSLYPAFTVLLAASVLRERVHGGQAVGLALSAVAVALIARG